MASILAGICIGLFTGNAVLGVLTNNIPSTLGWLCAIIWCASATWG